MIARVRALAASLAAVLGLAVLVVLVAALALLDAPAVLVALPALLVAVPGLALVQWERPGPALNLIATVLTAAVATALAVHDDLTVPGMLAAATGLLAAVADEPLQRRLVPAVRTVGLPGVPDDRRTEVPGPLTPVVLLAPALLAALLLVRGYLTDSWLVDLLVLLLLLAVAAWCVLRLRAAVRARRDHTVNAAVTRALEAYAPQFYVYFSGLVQGDYQVRMWLPYLERLGVPYAVLARDPRTLARAGRLTDAPVIAAQRIAALDDVMVPSVRAIFYVNTDALAVDGVRYLDRTHVHLNHGDSDKPSSYHPMIGMFDRIFVAGQAAVDRFATHGIDVPASKFRQVGRPQVADIGTTNTDPLPRTRTVLYAPTWRGGVADMSFSSLPHGERIVAALLDRGLRVIFRPHPYATRDRAGAAAVTRIDELLARRSSPETPHEGSAVGGRGTVAEVFNRSDALVTDVSSLASDYLRSDKPLAVTDLSGTPRGQAADPDAFPVLRAAYSLPVDADPDPALDSLLGPDPLAGRRRELRRYYLGDHTDEVADFVVAASDAVRATPRMNGV